MKANLSKFEWIREPKEYSMTKDWIEIITEPHTDLWQRTYYKFQNDTAPVLQRTTNDKYFSFTFKVEFNGKHRFDQCGVAMYLDPDNWIKASIELENKEFNHIGSVVTNGGFSDWATAEISARVNRIWYRLSRREEDFCIESSLDGEKFSQMRVCHMNAATDEIKFGIYAASPEDSTFVCKFSQLEITECKWKAHDGQQPD